MKIGIVCPYSWDVPGGVQYHVRDLAEELQRRGHTVSVLAPADDDTPVPPYVVGAGRAVPVRYNGSVARVNFGPLSATRTSHGPPPASSGVEPPSHAASATTSASWCS